VAFRFAGQYAFDNRLVPGFQRVAGGMYSVRGFKQSLVAGDSVFLGSLEYRFHLPRACAVGAPINLPGFGEFRLVPEQPGGRPDWDLIFKLFVDAGRVLTSDRERFEDHYTLVGAGAGVELQIRRNVTMRLDGGWALDDVTRRGTPGQPDTELTDRGDFEANFSITTLY
jgi:hemolysin activation/secretion protein